MVFVPNDFSSSYVVTHWTDPGNYQTVDTAPFAQTLINTTQTLPAPSSKDQAAAYAASNTALVQIDSNGDIYYMTNAVQGDYNVASGANWTKMTYSLPGVGSGSGSTPSGGAGASASGTGNPSGTRKGGASRTSGSASSTSSGAAGERASVGRKDVVGLLAGLVAVGGAFVL